MSGWRQFPRAGDDFVQDPTRGWSLETRVLDVVTLLCPACDEQTPGVIMTANGHPWPTYIADCLHCGEVILESEWNEVRP